MKNTILTLRKFEQQITVFHWIFLEKNMFFVSNQQSKARK